MADIVAFICKAFMLVGFLCFLAVALFAIGLAGAIFWLGLSILSIPSNWKNKVHKIKIQ